MSSAEWIVGYHAVAGLLAGGRPVEVVWLQDGRRDRRSRQILETARSRDVTVKFVPRTSLDRIAKGVPHNGCAARSAPVAFRPLAEVIAPEGAGSGIVVLDDVADPHNAGAVIRTAAALGIDGLVLAGPSAPPLGGALAKAAAGNLERVPLVRETVAADALAVLRSHGYWALGAQATGEPINAVRPTGRWVLCLGAEARGLRAKTRSQIDEWVAIPMRAGVESLNLSVAAGILLFELVHRWGSDAGS